MTPHDPMLRAFILGKIAQVREWAGRLISVERGKYGNTIVRFGVRSFIQRSGHGAICDITLGPLVIWCDPRTGRPFHWRWSA